MQSASGDRGLRLADQGLETIRIVDRQIRQHLAVDLDAGLGQAMDDDKPMDSVARFHLGNGARVERLNWAGDPSGKGVKQSYGLMVNYLYDLRRLDKHRALLAQGKIPVASGIEDLYI